MPLDSFIIHSEIKKTGAMTRRIIPAREPRSTPAPVARCAVRRPLRQREGECFGTLFQLVEAVLGGDAGAHCVLARFDAPRALALMAGVSPARARSLLRAGIKRLDAGAFGLRVENEGAKRALLRAGAVPAPQWLRLGALHIWYL